MAEFSGMPGWRRAVGLLALAGMVGALGGCRQRPVGSSDATVATVEPSYDAKTGRLERITYDRNGDGKPDAWLDMDGTRVVSAELDEDYDGQVDRWEHYGEQPGPPIARTSSGLSLPRSVLLKAEEATRGGGKPTRWETYEQGRLVGVQEDTTGDGRVNKWETYSDGVLQMLALDTKGTGKPDRRILYPPDGSSRLEVDEKGDGTFKPVAATH
jgi:hypothetical protein